VKLRGGSPGRTLERKREFLSVVLGEGGPNKGEIQPAERVFKKKQSGSEHYPLRDQKDTNPGGGCSMGNIVRKVACETFKEGGLEGLSDDFSKYLVGFDHEKQQKGGEGGGEERK